MNSACRWYDTSGLADVLFAGQWKEVNAMELYELTDKELDTFSGGSAQACSGAACECPAQ